MNELDPEISAVPPEPARSWARGGGRIRTRRPCEGERSACPDCPDCTLNAPLIDQWLRRD